MSERTDLKVGFACNNRCVFCAQGDKRERNPRVPYDDLVARMRAAYRPGRGLVLTGGEPTIRKDILRLVAAARATGYRDIQIQTNGRALAYQELVDQLVAAGVTELSPALHGPSAAVHDALTRAPGSFDQSAAGIGNAVRSAARVVTNTVVVGPNLAHLEATVGVLADLGVKRAQLAMVHPVGSAALCPGDLVPRIAEAAPVVAEAVRAGRGMGVQVVVEAMPLCFFRGLEDAVVEARIPDTTVVDLDGELFDFSAWRRESGKAKGPPCRTCARADLCEGPWREYAERDGWDGYVPFTEE
jgi:MoaA/NifB/PqqE/SkfB family radical SAM enzyme